MSRPLQMSVVFAVLCLGVVGTVFADEHRPAAIARPVLFVNTNSWLGDFVATNAGLKEFKEYAEEIGFRVEHGIHTKITDQILENISVYFLIYPKFSPTAEDKEALKRFLRRGGAVICCPWGYADPDPLEGFTAEFGIRYAGFRSNSGHTLIPISSDSLLGGPNPINQGVSIRSYYELLIDDPSKVISLVRMPGGQEVSVLSKHPNVGSGTLVMFGSVPVMVSGLLNGYLDHGDNKSYVKNMLHWLYPSCDLAVGKFKWQGDYPGPGDSVSTVLVIKNFGKSANDNLWTQYSLETGAGAGSQPVSVHTWNPINAKVSIEPGKKAQIRHALKVPSFIAPGEYVLRVVIDSKQVELDNNRANNTRVAKRIVIVQ